MPILTTKTELNERPHWDDVVHVVDVSDTTDDAGGTSFHMTTQNLVGRVALEEIDLSVAGEFDFGPNIVGGVIPAGFKRLIIKGRIESDAAVTNASVHCYFNTDTGTNDTDYFHTLLSGLNIAASSADDATPRVGLCGGSSAVGMTQITIEIEDYAGSELKCARGETINYRVAGSEVAVRIVGMFHDSMTAAITRIRIRTADYATSKFLGKLTLYAEM